MRVLLTLVMLVTLACSAAPRVTRVDADLRRLANDAHNSLLHADTAAQGHLQLAWLCLLHGYKCSELSDHIESARAADAQHPQVQLLHALIDRKVTPTSTRADKWLHVLAWAQKSSQPRDLSVTIALKSLSQLAEADFKGVVRAIESHSITRQQIGTLSASIEHPKLRSLATQALKSLSIDGDAMGDCPQQAQLYGRPSNARPMTQLERMPALSHAGRNVSFTMSQGLCQWSPQPGQAEGVYWL
ncbi:MAG: hypothetical protein CMH53_05155, partial [Myxococcales bacterium]|nr:hypothetical protein [Myxococcales bacterium]